MKTIRAVLITLFSAAAVYAGSVPAQINYQGTIKQQGIPVNGTVTMTFRLTSSDGTTAYWSSGDVPITVTQGMFAAVLSPTGVDWQNVTPFIEVSVAGQVLLPREPVTSNAYSLMSGSVIDASVTTASIADGSVTTSKLAAGAITASQIANGTITSSQLAPAAVTTTNLADGSVTTTQIAAAAVTPAQLAAQAVTTAALAPGAVTSSVLANQAVTQANLGPDVQAITVPSGLIAMFSGGCPSGWNRFTALDNAFPMGGPVYGYQGGSATHTHTYAGTTGTPSDTDSAVVFGSGQGSGSEWNNWGKADHTHTYSGTTAAASNLPPYVTVLYCQKQ
jgi:hypothetical protein